jgi:RimJ/RimL family protein N-acetyltransferase
LPKRSEFRDVSPEEARKHTVREHTQAAPEERYLVQIPRLQSSDVHSRGAERLSALRPESALQGRIVRVEPIAEHHREGLRDAAEREPQIHRYTSMYSLGFERWFDEALASTTEIPFVVHVGGRPVGSTRYLNTEPFHRRTEIGWTWLERAQWGTGANIETKYLLLRNAFEDWGAMRVEFKTDARNLRVRGALLGIGATFEGIFRKHMVLPDSIRDSAWYAILDDDWPAVKALLEQKIEKHSMKTFTKKEGRPESRPSQ